MVAVLAVLSTILASTFWAFSSVMALGSVWKGGTRRCLIGRDSLISTLISKSFTTCIKQKSLKFSSAPQKIISKVKISNILKIWELLFYFIDRCSSKSVGLETRSSLSCNVLRAESHIFITNLKAYFSYLHANMTLFIILRQPVTIPVTVFSNLTKID